jgi:hypothetical protein
MSLAAALERPATGRHGDEPVVERTRVSPDHYVARQLVQQVAQ